MNTDFDLIKRKYEMARKEGSPEADVFGLLLSAYGVMKKVLQVKDDDNLKPHYVARNNFIVNVATVFEVFIKNIIMSREWHEEGYKELLKERLSLIEAYDLFYNANVTRQYIVCHFYSFQKFEVIGRVLSALLRKDFYNEIEYQQTELVVGQPKSVTSLNKSAPEWRTNLIEIFEIRNTFIHDGGYSDIDDSKVDRYFTTTLNFIFAIESYLLKLDNDELIK